MKSAILTLFMSFCIFLQPVYANYNPNRLGFAGDKQFEEYIEKEMKCSVQNLSDLDIVRNPFERWNRTDFITRRNAFEMIYPIVHSLTLIGGREIYIQGNEVEELYLKGFNVTDISPGAYDATLFCAFFDIGTRYMINGRTDTDGNIVVAFDEYTTYYEACVMVVKLFTTTYEVRKNVEEQITSSDNAYPYFDLIQEMGLVNGNTAVNASTLTIDESQLNQPIPAYEFMHLLNSALYEPCVASLGDYDPIPEEGFRYIEHLEDFFPKDYSIYADDEDVILIP